MNTDHIPPPESKDPAVCCKGQLWFNRGGVFLISQMVCGRVYRKPRWIQTKALWKTITIEGGVVAGFENCWCWQDRLRFRNFIRNRTECSGKENIHTGPATQTKLCYHQNTYCPTARAFIQKFKINSWLALHDIVVTPEKFHICTKDHGPLRRRINIWFLISNFYPVFFSLF